MRPPASRANVRGCNPPGIDVLNHHWLAGILVNGIDGDIIFSAGKNRVTLEIRYIASPVCLVHELAVRMHVNGSCHLSRPDVFRFSEAVLREHGAALRPPSFDFW